jgi:hypothetical protein
LLHCRFSQAKKIPFDAAKKRLQARRAIIEVKSRGSTIMKGKKKIFGVRTTNPIAAWVQEQAELNGSTVSAVYNSAVREKMEREREAQAAKDRALAPAGA